MFYSNLEFCRKNKQPPKGLSCAESLNATCRKQKPEASAVPRFDSNGNRFFSQPFRVAPNPEVAALAQP